ncbi:MAG TPA: hypothetical protein VJU83_01900 [Burkholderiales bacterium]|nr:hypothetical protein [Burkholderiales bacterium]
MEVKRSNLFEQLTAAEKAMLGGPPESLTRALIRTRQELARPDEKFQAVNTEFLNVFRRSHPEAAHFIPSLQKAAAGARNAVRVSPGREKAGYLRDWKLPPPPDIQGAKFSWVQTRVFGGHGIDLENQGPIAFIKGEAADLGGDRVVFPVGMESFFMIPTQALRLMSRETPPRWSHSPIVSILGTMSAFTSLNFIFSLEDHWAKCRLYLRCEVSQAPAVGVPPSILSTGGDRYVIFNRENNLGWDMELVQYDNYLIVDTPSFVLAHDTEHVMARVEIIFEVEVEGSAEIRFRAPNARQDQQATFTMAVRDWKPWGWNR